MRRIGKKGAGRFERIGWDEAVAQVADTLLRQKERYGPESLAILSPAKRPYSDLLQRLAVVHGTPNYGHSGICVLQRAFAFMYTFADWPVSDYNNSDMIIYWGCQPIFSGPVAPAARAFMAARQRGARLIAIKPSVEPDVGLADTWVPVRPGTDAALALAMLHVVIGADLIDHAFVEQWCYGFEALAAHVRRYSPAWADIVIPLATGYETDHPFQMGPRWLMPTNRVIPHLGPYKSMFEFILDLACAMGHGDDFRQGDVTACMDDQLSSLGTDMQALRRHPTGITYPPPPPPAYEKYEQVFRRPSPGLDKRPFLPHARMAGAAGKPFRNLSPHSFRLPYLEELQCVVATERSVFAGDSARSSAARSSRHGCGAGYRRRRLGVADLPPRPAQGQGRTLSRHTSRYRHAP